MLYAEWNPNIRKLPGDSKTFFPNFGNFSVGNLFDPFRVGDLTWVVLPRVLQGLLMFDPFGVSGV